MSWPLWSHKKAIWQLFYNASGPQHCQGQNRYLARSGKAQQNRQMKICPGEQNLPQNAEAPGNQTQSQKRNHRRKGAPMRNQKIAGLRRRHNALFACFQKFGFQWCDQSPPDGIYRGEYYFAIGFGKERQFAVLSDESISLQDREYILQKLIINWGWCVSRSLMENLELMQEIRENSKRFDSALLFLRQGRRRQEDIGSFQFGKIFDEMHQPPPHFSRMAHKTISCTNLIPIPPLIWWIWPCRDITPAFAIGRPIRCLPHHNT